MIYAGCRRDAKGDERYTPKYAVIPIIKYLPQDKIVWCPFDTRNSEFVRTLSQAGFVVTYSHIDTGQDFFNYEPSEWDIIVSNPPFSKKFQVMERCLSLGKPFALLLSNLWLNSSIPYRLFHDRELQMLLFDRRINYSESNSVFFGSGYFGYNLFPKQIIFEKLTVHKGELSLMRLDMEKQ